MDYYGATAKWKIRCKKIWWKAGKIELGSGQRPGSNACVLKVLDAFEPSSLASRPRWILSTISSWFRKWTSCLVGWTLTSTWLEEPSGLATDSLCLLKKNQWKPIGETLFSSVPPNNSLVTVAGPLKCSFELTRRPSRALDSPRALLPELRRYKDTVNVPR